MISNNPFGNFREDCERALKASFNSLYPSISVESFMLSVPSNPEFGELTSTVFFELGKKLKEQPLELAKKVANVVEIKDFPLINKIDVAGSGYINFHSNLPELAEMTLNSIIALNTEYGYVKTQKPNKIIVEHTSANPIEN